MFNATFSIIFQLCRVGQFYWWRKPEYLKKTTDMPSHWQTVLHYVVSSTPRHERRPLTSLKEWVTLSLTLWSILLSRVSEQRNYTVYYQHNTFVSFKIIYLYLKVSDLRLLIIPLVYRQTCVTNVNRNMRYINTK